MCERCDDERLFASAGSSDERLFASGGSNETGRGSSSVAPTSPASGDAAASLAFTIGAIVGNLHDTHELLRRENECPTAGRAGHERHCCRGDETLFILGDDALSTKSDSFWATAVVTLERRCEGASTDASLSIIILPDLDS